MAKLSLCVAASLYVASSAAAALSTVELRELLEPLSAFSWEGDVSVRDGAYSQLARQTAGKLSEPVEAAELLRLADLPTQARPALAEAVYERFSARLYDDLFRPQLDATDAPWLCVAMAEFVSAAEGPRVQRFYERLFAMDLPAGAEDRSLEVHNVGVCLGAAGVAPLHAVLRAALGTDDSRLRLRAATLTLLLGAESLRSEVLAASGDPAIQKNTALRSAIESFAQSRPAAPPANVEELTSRWPEWAQSSVSPLRKLDPAALEALLQDVEHGKAPLEGNQGILFLSATAETIPRLELAFRRMCLRRNSLAFHSEPLVFQLHWILEALRRPPPKP